MNDSAWARSLFSKSVSEFLLFSPIKPGRIPGERRTYLQRVEDIFATLTQRTDAGLPTALTTIPTIHFARWALIRPEHLLVNVDEGQQATATPSPDETPPTEEGASPDKVQHTWLLTAVVFDGEASVYSRELATSIGDQLDGIFGNCVGYPPNGAARDTEGLWAWFRTHQLPTAVFHAAYGHLSVVRIRMLETFKAQFDAFVARVRPMQGAAPANLNFAFDEFLRENQQYFTGFPASGGSYPPFGREGAP